MKFIQGHAMLRAVINSRDLLWFPDSCCVTQSPASFFPVFTVLSEKMCAFQIQINTCGEK